ncbi:MAG TPA: helix-turn-helix domain-containing protein [Chloroflexota bacterium]|nr:helix-turn-helix domain-containing protein [Chloroflexota bacterium]
MGVEHLPPHHRDPFDRERLGEAGPRGLPLRELHRAVRLKPTTAHSLLRSLQAGRYVEQDAGTGHYRLGVRLLWCPWWTSA